MLKSRNDTLFDALENHFELLKPTPSNSVTENLSKVGVNFINLTPDRVRTELSKMANEHNFPLPMEQISIKMLSQKSWICEIFRYCYENGSSASALIGLPLELKRDQTIDMIGRENVLLDINPDFELFQDDETLFLDSFYLQEKLLQSELPQTWKKVSLNHALSILLENWNHWNITQGWIEHIVRVIVDAAQHDVNEATSVIKKLPILYDENSQWHTLTRDAVQSPVWYPHEELGNVDLLREIGLELVHPRYLDSYKPLLKFDRFINELSSKMIAKYLLALSEYGFFEDQNVREYLIDLISQDITFLTEFSEQQRKRFARIAFIYTTDDRLCSIATCKLFLAAQFNPPEHIQGLKSSYHIVHVSNNTQLELYKALGIEEQTPDLYIREVILPFVMHTLDQKARIEVLQWLASNWKGVVNSLVQKTHPSGHP